MEPFAIVMTWGPPSSDRMLDLLILRVSALCGYLILHAPIQPISIPRWTG